MGAVRETCENVSKGKMGKQEHVDRSPDCAFNAEGQPAASVA